MSIFATDYSAYYNLLYKDKNYQQESDYVFGLAQKFLKRPAKNLLDVGCGTGKHANCFKNFGLSVTGVDLSHEMIEIAKKTYPELRFSQGSASEFSLDQQFDVVTSLFHVASYQTQDNELNSYFKNISKHVVSGGLFIFDFWYGPAVLSDPPTHRLKRLENEDYKIVRFTEPGLRTSQNIVDVHFDVFVTHKKTSLISHIQELHQMRYLFIKEVDQLLRQNDIELIHSEEWMSGQQLSGKTWYACCVGKKK